MKKYLNLSLAYAIAAGRAAKSCGRLVQSFLPCAARYRSIAV